MPIESISLSPEAHAIFIQWPMHDRVNGRSAQVSRCVLFSRVWEAEIKRLEKEVVLLKKDKEQLWQMVEEKRELLKEAKE
jgi:hypothetical protein